MKRIDADNFRFQVSYTFISLLSKQIDQYIHTNPFLTRSVRLIVTTIEVNSSKACHIRNVVRSTQK